MAARARLAADEARGGCWVRGGGDKLYWGRRPEHPPPNAGSRREHDDRDSEHVPTRLQPRRIGWLNCGAYRFGPWRSSALTAGHCDYSWVGHDAASPPPSVAEGLKFYGTDAELATAPQACCAYEEAERAWKMEERVHMPRDQADDCKCD